MPVRRLVVPEPALVVLAGPAGSGKSTFARRWFADAEILSSDRFRELVSGDAGDQDATSAAFSLLRHALAERVKRRRLTVVDATNLTRRERARLLGVARRHQLPGILVAFDLPLAACQRAAADRERRVDGEVVARQHATFRRELRAVDDEPFDEATVLTSYEEVDAVQVERRPERRRSRGPDHGPDHGPASARRPPAVVVDLDGTLTSAAWREHLVAGPSRDWAAFFAGMGRDAPVGPLVELVGWVADRAAVVLLTGRPDDHEPAVRRWLADHDVTYDLLLLRPRGDRRPDTVVKRERYRRDVAPHYDVRLVIDDRPRVVEMWREEGLYVLTAVDPRLEPLEEPG